MSAKGFAHIVSDGMAQGGTESAERPEKMIRVGMCINRGTYLPCVYSGLHKN